jgi:hypothetical protein
MTKNLKYTALCLLVTLLASACSKDGADGNEVTNRNEAKKEIGIKPDVWKMAEGTTRTTFYTNSDLATFKCAAYNENTMTAYIDPVDVYKSGDNWIITGRPYYWPASGNLDFFAYMPAPCPGYIPVAPTYSATSTPSITHTISFTCSDLPMTYTRGSLDGQGSGLSEFVYALALGQNGTDNASGVNLSFQHPFTRIKMELSASQVDPITIKSITFKSVKTGGTFTYNGSTSTWDTSEGASANFVATLNQTVTITNAVQTLGEPYLMIPQSWTGQIEVRIIWNDWGVQKEETLTASAPTTWKIGYSYTYSFTISKSALIVNVARFTEQW